MRLREHQHIYQITILGSNLQINTSFKPLPFPQPTTTKLQKPSLFTIDLDLLVMFTFAILPSFLCQVCTTI
jgi:hypothetical protein